MSTGAEGIEDRVERPLLRRRQLRVGRVGGDRSGVTTSFSTFSDYAAGASVNRYSTATRGAEWSVVDEFNTSFGPYDQSIISSAGNNALRLSNAVTSSRFSDQVWSPSVAVAGESGAGLFNDRGSNHTAPLNPPNQNGTAVYNGFRLEFDFWSVTGTTQQGLFTTVSPGAKQSGTRQSWLGLDGNYTDSLGRNGAARSGYCRDGTAGILRYPHVSGVNG